MTDERKDLDEFLAAPETLRQNERELKKARQRKAREKAERERLKASKRPGTPTIEDMIGDIVRVAEDKETNPFWRFRSISRRRYELYGHYPIEYLDREFGQFEHAKQVAGLSDQPGTRLWRANRAKESRREHAGRYFERYVRPYVATAEEYRRLEEPYLLLSISDTHSMMLCPFVWMAFLQAIRDLRPDGILFNGDTLDAVGISRHPKIPGWTPRLKDELTFKREMFRQVREDHEGDIFDTGGNHDLVDRLTAYLTQVAPDIIDLPTLRVDELMGLEEYRVKLFHGGSILSPPGTEDAKPGFLLHGFYRVHHGTKLGQQPALAELRAAGRSGQSGHVHRADLAYGTTERDEGLSWMVTPMGARHEVGRSYIRGTTTGWQRGFGVAWLYPDGSVHQYPVVVTNERITVEGHVYVRSPNLHDPPPDENWLEDFRV